MLAPVARPWTEQLYVLFSLAPLRPSRSVLIFCGTARSLARNQVRLTASASGSDSESDRIGAAAAMGGVPRKCASASGSAHVGAGWRGDLGGLGQCWPSRFGRWTLDTLTESLRLSPSFRLSPCGVAVPLRCHGVGRCFFLRSAQRARRRSSRDFQEVLEYSGPIYI